ncbi:MAG: Asp-tRNA(Asn)/Glu-tRNA(Gln) amidotransferase GatCAB subunit B, partial [Spirochaetales bacterium]|nr:Asp-tRNA(Asn)/Glu-tRNA(Gln) amidotransferase GatCAB subunit B [Spirochaetales bacterium]
KDPEEIIREKGWEAITSESQLEPIVDRVFAEQAAVVAAVRAGDQRQKGFLVGQVMQATGGRATPTLVNQLLSKKLS